MGTARRGFAIALALVLLLSASQAATTAAAPSAGGRAPIDPYLFTVLQARHEAEFYVVLKVQADLSGAYALPTKEARGQYVFEALTEVAAKTQGPILQALATGGVDHQSFWIRNVIRVRGDEELLARLAARPDVAYLYYELEAVLDESPPAPSALPQSEAIEWNILRVKADRVWAQGITGEGAVVGHLDTGVDWEHPALARSYRPQIPGAPTRHDYNWWAGRGGSQVPVDYGTHGTATLGVIVGVDGDNQIGVAPGAQWISCAGVQAPNASPMECLQFFLAPTRLDGSDPRPDLAPDVINNSWSKPGVDYHDIIRALHAAGILFVKAAANEGPDCKTISNPGQWPEVTAVGAFDRYDEIAAFSSRGPAEADGREVIKPDLAAPGVDIRTSYPGGLYSPRDGTSMSCPHVVGGVALLISARPELAGQVDLLQEILERSAEPRIDRQCPPDGPNGVPNNVWGHGILDTSAAVQVALDMGGLAGTVSDGLTQDPVAGAQITFRDTLGWGELGRSGADGGYEQALLAGTFVLTTTHYGYLPAVDTGVIVPPGLTVTHDITLDLAPVWTISGTVTEALSGAPLAASVVFQDTPVAAETDPDSGTYAAAVAEGQWWMLASSPGHAPEERLVTVDGDQTQDFSLPAIQNYYLLTSNDPCDPPAFDWLDATGGDARCLIDDSAQSVPLPVGRAFPFYGVGYSSLWVGSNGHVTFGSGWDKWSGPLPDPAPPNNGIYAFSTDLNPASCAQGTIYTDYLEDRYFVIQFDQVQHYPSGDPETFEIVLDLDTGRVIVQFLTVSDASEAVVGVENAEGSEATQYAYADPDLITDLVRVEFHPAFGTPPPTGPGEVLGIVSDADTGLPIEGAIVTAEASGGGDPYEFTAGPGGDYSGLLCPDTYTMMAEAPGYVPSDEVQVDVFPAETTVLDFSLMHTEADLWLAKTAPAIVRPGVIMSYTLSVGCAGPQAVPVGAIVDSLPAGVEYLSSTGGTYSEPDHQVLWELAGVAPGFVDTLQIVVQVTDAVPYGEEFCNGAQILATGPEAPIDPDLDNNGDGACTTVEPYRFYLPILLQGFSP